MNKYIKYLIYLLPIVFLIYLGQKQQQQQIYSNSADKLVPVEPPHSHDYAYKRAYLNPVNKTNEACRANINKFTCNSDCMSYHYNFPNYVYRQPKDIKLSGEDGNAGDTEYVIKKLNYY